MFHVGSPARKSTAKTFSTAKLALGRKGDTRSERGHSVGKGTLGRKGGTRSERGHSVGKGTLGRKGDTRSERGHSVGKGTLGRKGGSNSNLPLLRMHGSSHILLQASFTANFSYISFPSFFYVYSDMLGAICRSGTLSAISSFTTSSGFLISASFIFSVFWSCSVVPMSTYRFPRDVHDSRRHIVPCTLVLSKDRSFHLESPKRCEEGALDLRGFKSPPAVNCRQR
ncbi:hypothetical protein BJ875DRAFT_131074 [Amylocarpus encephaloides]|uniref:Uncharacterized protein n=1 Tax=Amylocarpus encephaloides TaxID=45428 RepID=A0A9P7YPP3_9HELO|nr:hypothetical protein BJ875DRAFT_131074 [Amylocarpus encephaloides]